MCRVDIDGAERSAKDLWESRRAWVAETLNGTIEVSATFDAENGAIFKGVVEDVTQELSQADQAAARAAGPEVLRSRSQLVADALVEMARRASRPSGKQARPLVHLVVNADTLQGRLGDVPITPATARRLCCDANLARVVTDPKSVIIDLGAARNPSDPLRHLLQARHHTCIWPGCTIASKSCQMHHIDHAFDGGPTRLDNLAPICAHHHHRLLHEGGFNCEHNSDRTNLTFNRPDGRHIGHVAMNPGLI